MTLVVSINGPQFAVIASDRLVTLAHPRTHKYLGDHDKTANKLINLVTVDAVVCIGYSGSAYLGKTPTDHWIVDTVSNDIAIFGVNGIPNILGMKRKCRLRLHQICNRLRRGLSAVAGGGGVKIQIVGYRVRRRKLVPISITLEAATRLSPSPNLRMRFQFPLTTKFSVCGVRLRRSELEDVANKFRIDTIPLTEQRAREFLTQIIRNKAQVDKTVGSDVMSATIFHPSSRLVECMFDSSVAHYGEETVGGQHARLLVAHDPWVLTPSFFKAPTEATGDLNSGAEFSADGWRFLFKSAVKAEPTPSSVMWVNAQKRRPPPG